MGIRGRGRNDLICLVKEVEKQDEYGVYHSTQQKREVYASIQSVTQTEFFEAGRIGLNPQYKVVVFFGDYDGEETAEINGKTYSIYRQYSDGGDDLELYLERKVSRS